MASEYLLPCPSCQSSNHISVRQAGETISCASCDQPLEIPPLSGIRKLDEVAETGEKPKVKRDWSHSQGVYFSGGLLAFLIGSVLTGVLISFAMRLDTEVEGRAEIEESFNNIDELDVSETWSFWDEVIGDRPIGEWHESEVELNRRWRRALLIVTVPAAILAVGGLFSMFYSQRSSNSKQTRKPPRQNR